MPSEQRTEGDPPGSMPLLPVPNPAGRIDPTTFGWRPRLSQYPRHVALAFKTKESIEKVIDRLWEPDSPLFGVPRSLADGETLVVPADAVPHFHELGVPFEQQVVTRGRAQTGADFER
jgi:hypothetical protein